MKVILAQDVSNLGRKGEVREVTDGYAKNYLIPRHIALPATTLALEKIQQEQQELQARIGLEAEKAKGLAEGLAKKIFTIKAKANKQTLFAAIHEKEVADAINKKTNAGISPDQIVIKDQIKSLGPRLVELKLGPQIITTIKINVEAQ